MKHIIPVITISGLLLCLVGCSKPIEGEQPYRFLAVRCGALYYVLATNHTFTLKPEDGSSTLGGDWRLEGSRLITIGQFYTNGLCCSCHQEWRQQDYRSLPTRGWFYIIGAGRFPASRRLCQAIDMICCQVAGPLPPPAEFSAKPEYSCQP